MITIPLSPIWTSIVARVLRSGLSGSFSAVGTCDRCRSVYAVLAEGGTLSLECASSLPHGRLSRFRLSAEVTADGKLSMVCGCDVSTQSEPVPTGAPDGTSCIEKRSETPEWPIVVDAEGHRSADACGCDASVNHLCERHSK